MKNTIEKAMFGLSTCRKVSTTGREPEKAFLDFWYCYFYLGVSKLSSA
jgi:hypothetical protein